MQTTAPKHFQYPEKKGKTKQKAAPKHAPVYIMFVSLLMLEKHLK